MHAEHLVVMMREALAYAGLGVQDLTGVAVSKGPGSYTGLRIGVSAAKGLVFSHDLYLIGVPSLEALATGAIPLAEPGDTVVTAFNSRRREVYLGMYRIENRQAIPVAGVVSLQEKEIAPFIAQHAPDIKRCVLAGEGAPFVAECLGTDATSCKVIPTAELLPSASVVATMGAARHKMGLHDDPGSFEPYYLNAFIPKARKKSVFDRLPF